MNILTKILAGLCIVILTCLLLTLHLYSGVKGNYLMLKDKYDQQLAVNNLTGWRLWPDIILRSAISGQSRRRRRSISMLRQLLKPYLKRMNVLPLLCLAVLPAGCSNTRETFVPAPVVPVPAHLLADCPLPVIPDELTYGGAILLLTDAMKTIADCNHDKRAIREFEQMRASGAESNKGNVL